MNLIQVVADHAEGQITELEAEAADLERRAAEKRVKARVIRDMLALAKPHAKRARLEPESGV